MLLSLLMGCGEPALVRQSRKARLVNDIRHALLESVEAEKSAVLATTDEESHSFADETKRSAAEVNRLRGELDALIRADGRAEEVEALAGFDAAWAALESVDQRLLALAVANSNLKAARLAAREGAATIDLLVDALAEAERDAADAETVRVLSRASVAALRVQALSMVHIPSPDDAEMTRLEKQMQALSDEVDRSLASAAETGRLPPEKLEAATRAWSDYRPILARVIKLSRENTNVISFGVSVHEKRLATRECLAKLSVLLNAVEPSSRATR
jgi:hypothetical protein